MLEEDAEYEVEGLVWELPAVEEDADDVEVVDDGAPDPLAAEEEEALAALVLSTSDDNCFRVCVRFLLASASALVSNFGL